MNNLALFELRKKDSVPISMVTCYDAWSAKILDQTDVDCLLVGDSLAEIVHGFDSTVYATDEMMALHTAAVARSAKKKFIVADMPFLSCSRGILHAMKTVEKLMRAGANALKNRGSFPSTGNHRAYCCIGRTGYGPFGIATSGNSQLGWEESPR